MRTVYWMGTRFVATEECDADESYKRLYLNCTENDVTIVRSPMKTSVRVMKNSFADVLARTGKEDYDIIRAVQKGIEGDHDNGLILPQCECRKDQKDRYRGRCFQRIHHLTGAVRLYALGSARIARGALASSPAAIV